MAFNLSMYRFPPTQYNPATGSWDESWFQADSITRDALEAMSETGRNDVYAARNRFPLPLVNYTRSTLSAASKA